MSLRITIIDYDAGNLRNVQKAFDHFGYKAIISGKVADLESADILILPGVGAFSDGMKALESKGLSNVIRKEVLENGKPILGICLGMQLLATEGTEGGERAGLGILNMRIERMTSDEKGLRIPHMGWESVKINPSTWLFDKVPDDADFYFAHSYHAICEDESIIAGACNYGHRFVAAIQKNNIAATQFHPEKSQRYGLQVLQNFMARCEALLQKTPVS